MLLEEGAADGARELGAGGREEVARDPGVLEVVGERGAEQREALERRVAAGGAGREQEREGSLRDVDDVAPVVVRVVEHSRTHLGSEERRVRLVRKEGRDVSS